MNFAKFYFSLSSLIAKFYQKEKFAGNLAASACASNKKGFDDNMLTNFVNG